MAKKNWESFLELKGREDFRFKKSLGQNILVDDNILRKIVTASRPDRTQSVLEIGPGTGALTERLLDSYGRVLALELDSVMIEVLVKRLGDREGFELIPGDVLETDLGALSFDKIVANLPYSLSTRAVSRILDSRARGRMPGCSSLHALLQEEVVDRICAPAGSRDSGPLSIKVSALGKARKLFRVSPNCFRPKPKIQSALLEVIFHERPLFSNPETFDGAMEMINFLFTMRRKKISGTLSRFLAHRSCGLKRSDQPHSNAQDAPESGIDPQAMALTALERAGLDPDSRPETHGYSDFESLYTALMTL